MSEPLKEDSSEVIYAITVPCSPDSITVLEGLCETFLQLTGNQGSDQATLVIRLAVAEACRNALAQHSPAGRISVCSLSFIRESIKVGAHPLASLILEITDPGRGLRVAGVYPPYPAQMHSQLYVLQEVLGQTLIARVENATTLKLLCLDEADSNSLTRRERIERMNERGLGLLALTRTWNRVVFTWDEEKGNTVRLSKPVLELK
ncbi:MAG: ATP-binding protein [Candidatus Sumerlaeia bacterium]|nr:ATP-binding protein [Candidatus Sumerlaeia bacterium]